MMGEAPKLSAAESLAFTRDGGTFPAAMDAGADIADVEFQLARSARRLAEIA